MGLATPAVQVAIAVGALQANAPAQSLVLSVPDGADFVKLACDRATWTGPRTDGVDAVRASLDVSFDGGVTWVPLVGFTAPGGVMYEGQTKTSIPAGALQRMESAVTCPMPGAGILGRKARANLTAFQALTSGLTVTWS